jgi:hypothetical protein
MEFKVLIKIKECWLYGQLYICLQDLRIISFSVHNITEKAKAVKVGLLNMIPQVDLFSFIF